MEKLPRPEPQVAYYYEGRPGQKFFLNEFITPVSYPVWNIARRIKGRTLSQIGKEIWDKVFKKMKYVLDHEQFKVKEYFLFPFELLKRKQGDCEELANTCTSFLVACGINAQTVYGAVEVKGRRYKHAWTEADGMIIETTNLRRFSAFPPPPEYEGEYFIPWGYGAYKGVGVEEKPRELRGWVFGEEKIEEEEFTTNGGEKEEEVEEEEEEVEKVELEELPKVPEELLPELHKIGEEYEKLFRPEEEGME